MPSRHAIISIYVLYSNENEIHFLACGEKLLKVKTCEIDLLQPM